jgi:hypothetical protein
MTELRFDRLDADGALGEAAASVYDHSRADFLRTAAIGSGALLAVLARPGSAEARSRDVDILNFALTLEYLQAAFYTEVERIGSLKGRLAHQSQVVGAHERAHVNAFRNALGRSAVARPRFDFRGATESPERFQRTAVAFEDLAVAAYKGQAGRLRSRAFLASALAVHAVEARHAAWIRRLAGASPVLAAFDEPAGKPEVLRAVRATNFIAKTRSGRSPNYTG